MPVDYRSSVLRPVTLSQFGFNPTGNLIIVTDALNQISNTPHLTVYTLDGCGNDLDHSFAFHDMLITKNQLSGEWLINYYSLTCLQVKFYPAQTGD